MWWRRPVIPAFERLRQEDREFEASLGYRVMPYLKKKKKKTHNHLVLNLNTLLPSPSALA
jgi:hypothetical protein